jgi:Zn-dependent protease
MGKAFGIPLYLHPTFFFIPLYALLVSWKSEVGGILLAEVVLMTLFGCILLHELGHALMARLFGIRTRDITLYPIGGVARLESMGGKPHQEIAIALAGPAVNLALLLLLSPLAVFAWGLGGIHSPDLALAHGGPVAILGAYLIFVALGNLVLLVFNLLPVFPMDGGRVLRALLSLGLSRLKATEVAATLGLVLACALGLIGLFVPSPSLVLVAVFVAIAGQLELNALRRYEASRRLKTVLVEVEQPLPTGHFTGLAWDPDRGAWVQWVNGVPLDGR